MEQLQMIFDRIEEKKKKLKDLKNIVKDALKNSLDYQDILSKLDSLRTKKRTIETAIHDQYASTMKEIDELDLDIKSENELLSDAALTTIMKGETAEVADQYKNVYDPDIKVRFKKRK